ncbi:MAG: DUF1738 domain-containing protein [Selenomonadaceae bacterium]|nr:DUF1738 domain-containing protein [Selenomonadaceae bacterium]
MYNLSKQVEDGIIDLAKRHRIGKIFNKVLMPINAKTMKAYKVIHMLIFSFFGAGETSDYVTFNPCQKMGGKIKKGAKSIPIVYWNRWSPRVRFCGNDGMMSFFDVEKRLIPCGIRGYSLTGILGRNLR